MKKVIIIGGGIAGLAAAYRFQELCQGGANLDVMLLEGSDRLGGKIVTDRENGFIVERGPDSFISQKPWAIELCKKLGLGDRLIGTNRKQTKTYVYTGKKMVSMPDGLSLMVPTQFMPFALSPLFSWLGKIRMGMDIFIPRKADDGDESLASFVRRRLGEEALQKMAEPMLAGIYASDPEQMSIKSTFPMFFQAEQKYRSLILGMVAQKRMNGHRPVSSSPYSLFMTLENGLGEMVDALVAQSPKITFRKETAVSGIDKSDGGWTVALKNGEILPADAVVVATPASVAARMLEPNAPEAAALLDKIRYVSTATVSMVYRKEGFSHPLNGFGFVIPRKEKRSIMACTWTSTKFPHRVPEGYVMIRCFIGGALQEDLAHLDAADLEKLARKELLEIMGVSEEPVFCRVFHNKKSNVQYQVGHAALIESVVRELSSCPGLFLAGSAYTGIGIPDCILNGTRAAESTAKYIGVSI